MAKIGNLYVYITENQLIVLYAEVLVHANIKKSKPSASFVKDLVFANMILKGEIA